MVAALVTLAGSFAFALSCAGLAGILPEGLGIDSQHPGWPLLTTIVGVLGLAVCEVGPRWAWRDRLREQLAFVGVIWRTRGWPPKLLIIAVCTHLLISFGYFLNAPQDVIERLEEERQSVICPTTHWAGKPLANPEYFFRQWKRRIPEKANVLYRGHWEAMVAAYRLYPRRLYLLPEDIRRFAAAWHDHRWLHHKTKGASLKDAWTDKFWSERLSADRPSTAPAEQFLAAKQIQYLAVFDEAHPESCQVIPLARATDLGGNSSLGELWRR